MQRCRVHAHALKVNNNKEEAHYVAICTDTSDGHRQYAHVRHLESFRGSGAQPNLTRALSVTSPGPLSATMALLSATMGLLSHSHKVADDESRAQISHADLSRRGISNETVAVKFRTKKRQCAES